MTTETLLTSSKARWTPATLIVTGSLRGPGVKNVQFDALEKLVVHDGAEGSIVDNH